MSWILYCTFGYTNWMVFLKINPTLTPKKTYVKFCCVVRNHTSLKNTCITSTYFLQSKPLLVDPRECSLMNLTNLIITMMAHTDYSINNFLLFSSSYSLPAFSAFSFSLFCDFSCLWNILICLICSALLNQHLDSAPRSIRTF